MTSTDVATAREYLEPTGRGACVGLVRPPAGARAEDRAGRLGERQRGRDPRPLRAKSKRLAAVSRSSNAATNALDSM